MKRFWTFAVRLIAFVDLVSALAGTAVAYPSLPAIAWPPCYGFEQVSDGLYANGLGTGERLHLQQMVDASRRVVSSYFDSLKSHPRILVCSDDRCFRALGGGGARAITILDLGLVVSVRGIDPIIVRHELAHAELHAELGIRRTLARTVPQWFDEGLAVNVSNDLRYLAPAEAADRCLVEPAGDLPASRAVWIHGAANDLLYAKAACKVSRWLDGEKGPEKVRALVQSLNAGLSFESAFANTSDHLPKPKN
ncbi:MAG: hypothetical protein JWL62_2922 [Hyphomicrobiales bacterium]|nr:hypothetical protein [Hyphomicrobiales bacterium]